MKRGLIRVLIVATLTLGVNYVAWRWLESINWSAWWIAVPLVLAETYSLFDAFLFGMTMWRVKERGEPPPAPAGATVDVFITTYNEPLDLVMTTARAARDIRYPHETWILDDGAREEMRAAAEAEGIGYLTRSEDWRDRPRHAKAGNLNNALFATQGEFLMILDADQVPDPAILDRTLGYFEDAEVALVQTPQYFTNVDEADPLGSQAPLFYGPIQQGKDGWNAAFFCGSNAVLRREALMQLGVAGYVREVERDVRRTLRTAGKVVKKARAAAASGGEGPAVIAALDAVGEAVRVARAELDRAEPISEVTYRFQQRVDDAARGVVAADLDALYADLAEIQALPAGSGIEAVAGPPDPGQPWMAEIRFEQVDHHVRFMAVAEAPGSEDRASADERSVVAVSPEVPWPPADPSSVEAMNGAVRTVESVLADGGWRPAGSGGAWYAKRFAWEPPATEAHASAAASAALMEDATLERLSQRDWSPLGALETIRALVHAIDVDRDDEAQPVMPMATISVTEDMATAMRLHAMGWRTVYHHEVLAHGLAPEDLGTMLHQRLRWAQGTLQVMLRENPLVQRGLSLGQKLMYFSTMWTYLSGFAALVYIAAPVIYLFFGIKPVKSFGGEFLTYLIPYLVFNQLLFFVVGYGVKTWRGQQYSLALFPLWIRACTTAIGNVIFGRELGFVVTPKTRQEGGGFPWKLIRPQLIAMGLLVVACVVGLIRLAAGVAPSAVGTWVNIAWIIFDLVVLSVILQAARYKGYPSQEEVVA